MGRPALLLAGGGRARGGAGAGGPSRALPGRRLLAAAAALAHASLQRHRLASSAAASAAPFAPDPPFPPSPAPPPPPFLLLSLLAAALVLLAGLVSGLTLALMSMDAVELEVLRRSGSRSQRARAARLAPVLADEHWLLVSLLVVNAACMEALPLVLDRIMDPRAAVALSVTAVLIFGEIAPQAVCSRYGLAIGAGSAPLVKLLMLATCPVSWPVARLLDLLLGKPGSHEAVFRRKQLKALVGLHAAGGELGLGDLTAEEVAVICGALDLTSKTARR
jgi:metal transporter CNNM